MESAVKDRLHEAAQEPQYVPNSFQGMVYRTGDITWEVRGPYQHEGLSKADVKDCWTTRDLASGVEIGEPASMLTHVFRGHLHNHEMLQPPHVTLQTFRDELVRLCRLNDTSYASAERALLGLLLDGLVEIRRE